jgi:L-ascorbate metabolism protein UlaG (beta-lactamase superfamily)
VVELGWWETHREGDLSITQVPAQHWSMRMPWDRNKRLWGGFVVESSEGIAYHAGDTAMSEVVFREIGKRFPKIDWAMLPIGAYDPAWFMQPQHMGPEEATLAFELLGARHLCAMHWGTFKLTDEPMGEPPQRLRARADERSLEEERLWIFDVGETRALAR